MDRPIEERGWSRRWRLGLIGLVAVGIAALALLPAARRWSSTESSIERARIRTAVVERGTLVRDVALQGNVVAAFSPTLVSPARGTVRVLARAGEVVAISQPLVTVESPQVESLLDQERSTVRSLEADLERQRIEAERRVLEHEEDLALFEVELAAAQRAVARAESIRAEGLINAVEYEKAQDDLKVAEMKLQAARKKASFARESLAFEVSDRASRLERQRLVVTEVARRLAALTLRSPVAGRVSRVEVDDRDSVVEGQPLVAVVDLSALEVEVAVPEAYADELAPGMIAEITYDGAVHAGRLKDVAPEVSGSRVRATVVFAERLPAGLRQNQRVSTRLLLETREDVLKLDRGPFLEAGGGRVAYVIEDGVASRRAIEVGSLSVAEVEIVGGLEVGAEVIVSDTTRFDNAERILLRR